MRSTSHFNHFQVNERMLLSTSESYVISLTQFSCELNDKFSVS